MYSRILAVVLTATSLSLNTSAQATQFTSPGMPTFGTRELESTQATRFSNEFNPAFSFIIDAVSDYQNFNGGTPDGVNAELRVLELGAQSWIDPTAFGYFIAATDGEFLAIEEAAIHYVGFEGNSTLRAGRFFIDFGKQMQTHVHELRTVERPLALRALLGEEVKGDGVQWDSWAPVGDGTLVRWSIGAFSSLLPEENEFVTEFESSVGERKDAAELNFTARVTALADVTDNGTLQVGASGRWIPDYQVEFAETEDPQTGLMSSVYGLDLTYALSDETREKVLTIGSEWLVETGDGGAESPTPGTINILSRSRTGYYGYIDYAWNQFNSAGFQYSAAELGDPGQSRVGEADVYFTHKLSEFQRLRLGVNLSSLENGEDSTRAVLQYTAILGAHGHGINW